MGGRKPGTPKTGGRKKGTPNKLTATVKEAIERAFHEVGGHAYLVKQAKENPQAFITLLGKVIPLQVAAEIATTTSSIAGLSPDEIRARVSFVLAMANGEVPGVGGKGLSGGGGRPL